MTQVFTISRGFPLKAIGTLLSVMESDRRKFRDECDDAIAMCELAFWDDSQDRCDFLAPV